MRALAPKVRIKASYQGTSLGVGWPPLRPVLISIPHSELVVAPSHRRFSGQALRKVREERGTRGFVLRQRDQNQEGWASPAGGQPVAHFALARSFDILNPIGVGLNSGSGTLLRRCSLRRAE